MVVHGDALSAHGVDFEAVRLHRPFAPDDVVLAAHHAVEVVYVCACAQVEAQVAHPFAPVYGSHPVGS